MNKIIAAVVVIIILAGGGYALAKHNHDKNKTTTSNTTSTSSSSSKTAAVNNAVLVTKTNSSVGSYLADPSGNTLYTYGGDSNGVSNCSGSCISAWPAYEDSGSTSGLPTNVSTFKRSDDSKMQFTYKGLPLYTFSSDTKGQVSGNGVSDFSVAKP